MGRVFSLLPPPTQSSQSAPSPSITAKMITKGLILVLLCFQFGYSLEVSVGRDSNVYPLFMNPFDVTHWKCLGYTVYENTEKSALYTYDVDVCFMAALAAKIGFPWIYEYVTGNNFFQALGLTSRSDDYAENYLEYSEDTFDDKASALITEMEKAVYKDPQPYATPADSYSGYNKYNRFPKQF